MSKQMRSEKLFYRGPSMAGTFKPGDRLLIEKVPLDQLRKGDAIVFRLPGQGAADFVVHRVVRWGKAGPVTRGDNNTKSDDDALTAASYFGKVVAFQRGDRTHKSWNGWTGMLRAMVLHARLHVCRMAGYFLRTPYRLMKRSGLIQKIWRPEIEAIYFETPDGPLVKYVHKGKTVAGCWIHDGRWWFRRPYDFIIPPAKKP